MLKITINGQDQVIQCDDYYVRQLASGLDEVIFSVSIYDPLYPYITEETPVTDIDGQTYLVKQIDAGKNDAKVICQLDLNDWKALMHVAWGNGIKTVSQTVEMVKPSGWTVVDNSGLTGRLSINGNLTSYEVCVECCDAFGVYIRWNNKTKVVTITDKALADPVGAFVTRELNMTELNFKGKSNGIVTRLYAYGVDDLSFASINDGKPYVENHTYTSAVISAYWKDERYKYPETLLEAAQKKLAEMAVPVRSYSCSVVDLKASDPDKYGFLDFSMFTTATLIDDIKGFSMNYQVVERHTYPYYPEKNEVIFDSAPQRITKELNNAKEILSQKTDREQVMTELDRATGVLQTGKSGYVVIGRNSDGYANEIYFLDRPSLEDAVKVLRVNQAGIGFSSSGVAGPYYQSWTLDGFLSLGGVNNAYGTLQILDPSGKLICSVSKDGYTIYDADGSTVIGQWSHAGISLRKGVIDFQWGQNTVGFYADGEKIQLGDWIIDSQSYGRSIIQSLDEKTGMSADPGDSDGLYFWAGWNDEDDYVFLVNGSDAYVMYDGQAYPIGASIANLNAAVSAYIRDIESGSDDDGDEEGDGTGGTGEDTGGGYLPDDLLIDDVTPPSDPIGFDGPS